MVVLARAMREPAQHLPPARDPSININFMLQTCFSCFFFFFFKSTTLLMH